MVHRRDLITLTMVVSSLILLECWHWYKNPDTIIHPYMFLPGWPVTVQWYIQDLGDNITHIIWSVVMYRLARMKLVLRIIFQGLIFYTSLSFILYLVNFNQNDYSTVYCLFGLACLIAAYLKNKDYESKTIDERCKTAETRMANNMTAWGYLKQELTLVTAFWKFISELASRETLLKIKNYFKIKKPL